MESEKVVIDANLGLALVHDGGNFRTTASQPLSIVISHSFDPQ
jgi:hypothetical protein